MAHTAVSPTITSLRSAESASAWAFSGLASVYNSRAATREDIHRAQDQLDDARRVLATVRREVKEVGCGCRLCRDGFADDCPFAD